MPEETNLYSIPIIGIDGKTTTLETYKDQVLLIVNVASRCGFTSQYSELETLYQDYKNRGFTILGFPCDQFLHQEPGSNKEIKQFAESCFRVTFPLFAKIDVKGKNQAALYGYLKQHIQQKPWIFVPWNFTKILVDHKGNVLKRFLPTKPIKYIREEIESILTGKAD